jgi:hypothetical protein
VYVFAPNVRQMAKACVAAITCPSTDKREAPTFHILFSIWKFGNFLPARAKRGIGLLAYLPRNAITRQLRDYYIIDNIIFL